MEAGYGTLSATLGPDNPENDGYDPVKTTSTSDDDLVPPDQPKAKKKYPYSVFFILSNEFCERFSYYGMRAILVLYLTRWLSFEEDQATSIFHAFSMLCYLMPVFGAIIADGFIGRYKTILYLSIVYFVGSLVLSATAVPPPEWYGPAVGMLLIACGTGGIKASVAPFGADQFTAGQEKSQESFFSAFYFMINLGSMLSIIITPILRADVTCFGQDCYLLAFGVPAALMLLSICLFIAGRQKYRRVPPSGNVIWKTIKCIWYGIVGKLCKTSYEEKRSHWLYYADDKFDPSFIEDVKQLLKVLAMFLPLPLFWALSDQQGSRWTLQAEHMNGDLGIFGHLKPDQLQALNPLMILVLIPVFDRMVYPLLDKCSIPNRPLQRMVVGLFITAFAFVCAGLVQIKIDNAEDPVLSSGETGVTFLNTLPCRVEIKSLLYNGHIQPFEMSEYLQRSSQRYSVHAEANCGHGLDLSFKAKFLFEDGNNYRMIIYKSGTSLQMKQDGINYRMIIYKSGSSLQMKQFHDQRRKPKHGNAAVSVFNTIELDADALMFVTSNYHQPVTEGAGVLFNSTQYEATRFSELEPGEYTLHLPTQDFVAWINTAIKMTFGTGGVYTVVIAGDLAEPDVTVYVDVEKNTVSMAWMIPQYTLITLGEVLFSINGLGFAYSQAPNSLKSVVQAIWLLTVSFGDLVVIIVANIHAIPSQTAEFFLFAGLMFVDTIIFMLMSLFYTYKSHSLYEELEEESDTPEPVTVTLGENFPLHNRKQD